MATKKDAWDIHGIGKLTRGKYNEGPTPAKAPTKASIAKAREMASGMKGGVDIARIHHGGGSKGRNVSG